MSETPELNRRAKDILDDLRERIEQNPNVLNGTPVIKGTRIPVAHIRGTAINYILGDYPDLTREDVKAAFAFFVTEEQRPKPDDLAHQVAVASENVAGWPEWKRNGSTASPKPSADLEKVADECLIGFRVKTGPDAMPVAVATQELHRRIVKALSSAVASRDDRIASLEYFIGRMEAAKAKSPDWESLWEEQSERAEKAEADLALSREEVERLRAALTKIAEGGLGSFGNRPDDIAREALNVPSHKTPVVDHGNGADSRDSPRDP